MIALVKPEDRPSLSELAGKSGPVCPYCGCRHFIVPSTWQVASPTIFAKRQRVCRNCKKFVINTKEVPDE